MRLKPKFVMVILLTALLAVISIGLSNVDKEEVEIDEQVIEDVIPNTFCQGINNADNIPTEVLDVITNYLDDYYLSMYTLELQDTAKYFINEKDGQISNAAIKLIVESRKLYDFDFTMSAAHYILNVTNCTNINGKYDISFLEDDSFNFKFLNGITSEAYDIENNIVIEKVEDEYKISKYRKEQGYYTMFDDNRDDDTVENIYAFNFNRLSKTIQNEIYNKTVAESKPYVTDKAYKLKYDRNAATLYAQTYYHSRNDKYYDFSDEGGNCQNFASQTLVQGGLQMDESGTCLWYYNNHLDYVPSWVQVPSFYEYCDENNGSGIVCDINSNIYYAEPGDLVQVGISAVSHTTIVSRVVDGHILLNSNSIDMKDYPLEAYTQPVRKLIKILGSDS